VDPMKPPQSTFRPLTRIDFDLLAEWLSAPHVRTWWREESDPQSIEANYGPIVDGTDRGEVFIIERDGQPFGFIQRYLLDDNLAWQTTLLVTGTPSNAAGIDYFIGVEQLIGGGLGPEMIDRFIANTWTRYPDIEAVVVTVLDDNRRSWRALEKVGFTRTWSGTLDSDDASDDGTSHAYVLHRPTPDPGQ
jgi:aminoglycoside 6'-N-acetyltransferase